MSTDTLAVIGATTGTVGALTGVASLSWQIMTHRRAGRVVVVRSSYSIPVYGETPNPKFRGDDQIAVIVTNIGGASVAVLNFGIGLGPRGHDGNLITVKQHAMSTSLPATVQPGGTPVQVHFPVEELRRASKERGIPFTHMRAWVRLGDGRQVWSRNTVPLK